MPPTVRVVAVPGALLPYYADDGRAILGRFVGMSRAGVPAPETVLRTPYITRALARGDILLAPDLPAPEPAPAPPAGNAAPTDPTPAIPPPTEP